VTTPPREPSVVYLAVPRPVPAGPTTLTFRVEGTQTLQPTSGTLEVSINGGPTKQATVEQSTAELPVDLTPGTYDVTMSYSGDGAFLPSSARGRSTSPGPCRPSPATSSTARPRSTP
jgi:Bacterial Ig-like domain (group 3)